MHSIYGIIPKLNILLVISGLIMGFYLFISMNRPYHIGSLADKQVSVQMVETIKTLNSPAFSEDVFKKTELFRRAGKKGAAQDTKSLVLLGVSMGAKKLALIKDTRANKDYYCTEGDIAGGYKVISIQKDKVTLEYEGSTLEITR